MKTYNYQALKSDLIYFVKTSSFHGNEIKKSLYLEKVEQAEGEELIEIAHECGITSLKRYEIEMTNKVKR